VSLPTKSAGLVPLASPLKATDGPIAGSERRWVQTIRELAMIPRIAIRIGQRRLAAAVLITRGVMQVTRQTSGVQSPDVSCFDSADRGAFTRLAHAMLRVDPAISASSRQDHRQRMHRMRQVVSPRAPFRCRRDFESALAMPLTLSHTELQMARHICHNVVALPDRTNARFSPHIQSNALRPFAPQRNAECNDTREGAEMATILVTDDDRACRDTMQLTLERQGHEVEGAADVNGALDALHERNFDLIVCDHRMPGRTGLDLLLELKQQGSKIPFMMVSACADTDTEAAARRLGASGLLRKPFRRQDLIDAVGRGIA
jgi:CheY-like chemotaxis protein